MAVTKEQLDTLFTRIQELESRRKNVNGEISEAFNMFAEQYVEDGASEKVFKKAVKSAYKKFKEAQKDRAEFILLEAETDQLTERILEENA
jgi:AmiR/NasT family two-component response regulator